MSHTNEPVNEPVNEQTRTEVEAAVYRRLVKHLRARTDVQNIDLMNLADFCRNCLAKWYKAAAEERGVAVDYEQPWKQSSANSAASNPHIIINLGTNPQSILQAVTHI